MLVFHPFIFSLFQKKSYFNLFSVNNKPRVFESRSIEESPMEDVPSTSKENTRRDAIHILENLLDYGPEDKDDSPFFQLFQELPSVDGIDGIIILYQDNLHILYENLKRKKSSISLWSILSIKKLQFFFWNIFKKKKITKLEWISATPQLMRMISSTS